MTKESHSHSVLLCMQQCDYCMDNDSNIDCKSVLI